MDGDVLITTGQGLYHLGVVSHPQLLSFQALHDALELAQWWADANHAEIWTTHRGVTVRISAEETRSGNPAAAKMARAG